MKVKSFGSFLLTYVFSMVCGLVVQLLVASSDSEKIPGSIPGLVWGPSFALPVCAWFSPCALFSSRSPKEHDRLTDDSKFTPGVSVSVAGCLSYLSLPPTGDLSRV